MTIRHTKAEGPSADRLTDKSSFQLPKARKESQAAGDATAGCGAGSQAASGAGRGRQRGAGGVQRVATRLSVSQQVRGEVRRSQRGHWMGGAAGTLCATSATSL